MKVRHTKALERLQEKLAGKHKSYVVKAVVDDHWDRDWET